MPLFEEYDAELASPFADIANIGPGPNAKGILAALFLQRFIEETPWIHLDIAGVAYQGGSNKGATGKPLASLLQFLIDVSHAD